MYQRLFNNRPFQIAASFVFWLMVTAISASKLFIELGDRYDGGWLNMFVRQLPVWVPWAILMPIVFYGLEKIRRLPKAIISFGAHLGFMIGVLVVYTFLQSFSGFFVYQVEQGFLTYWRSTFLWGLWSNVLIYIAMVVLIYAILWYKSYKESQVSTAELSLKTSILEKELAEARIQALSMQLNPHFLFNSLHSVASLIRTDQKKDAINMIGGIGELLRDAIDADDQHLVAVQEELNFVKKYLSIEQIRFKDKLRIEYEINDNTLTSKVPRFILQPVVENALKHGLKDVEKDALLKIETRRVNGWININVSDNGKGFQEEGVVDHGLGLTNTRKRLENLYGENFEFSIRSMDSQIDGTHVEFNLPVNDGL